LRGNSIEIKDGRFFIKAKVKGGFFLNFELDDDGINIERERKIVGI
jgi:hypothetical protein